MCIFFFKQKTAYEMRISDWSSDVCSSDLLETPIVAFRTRFLEERRHRNCKTVAAGAARVLARDTIEPTFPAAREREVRRIDRKNAALHQNAVVEPFGERDRKSTRLNSSH